jgi:hypothetical protein
VAVNLGLWAWLGGAILTLWLGLGVLVGFLFGLVVAPEEPEGRAAGGRGPEADAAPSAVDSVASPRLETLQAVGGSPLGARHGGRRRGRVGR